MREKEKDEGRAPIVTSTLLGREATTHVKLIESDRTLTGLLLGKTFSTEFSPNKIVLRHT